MVRDNDRDHTNEADEQLELYVLGLLDEDEATRIERWLQENAAARERARQLRGVASMLALDLDPIAPSPDLKARILEEARAERDDSTPVELPTERARRDPAMQRSWLPWAVAAVLTIGLIASILWALSLQNQLAERPEIEQYEVAGVAPGISVTGELVVLEGDQTAVLSLLDLTQLDANQVYQIWLIEGERPQSAGTFLPDEQGFATLIVRGNLAAANLIAITVEPEGGSPQPTSDPIIVGELAG